MSTWSIAWLSWLAAFLLLEAAALLWGPHGASLSMHIWEWFGFHDHGPWAAARRAAFGGLLGWLVLHFLTHGRV
ncbi:hypothetical protein [Streptomyces fractus]|uniref:hypothetical protein n=1 Tax=Streptomyces fractus TaxID=641806 RepID=UPI003CF17CBC